MDNLNNVTNTNLSHINTLADGRMQNIESSGNAAVTNINDALARAMTEMDREATNLINKIVASANDQIASISNTVNGHIGNINSIADAGISNINNVTNVNLTKITNIGEEKLIQIRQEADEIAETVKGKAFHVGLEITSADTVKRLEKNKLYFILAGGIKNIKVYNKDGEIAFSTQATHVIAMTGTKNENGIVTAALLYFDPEQNAFVSDYVTAGMDEYPEARVEISYSSGSVEVIIGNTV